MESTIYPYIGRRVFEQRLNRSLLQSVSLLDIKPFCNSNLNPQIKAVALFVKKSKKLRLLKTLLKDNSSKIVEKNVRAEKSLKLFLAPSNKAQRKCTSSSSSSSEKSSFLKWWGIKILNLNYQHICLIQHPWWCQPSHALLNSRIPKLISKQIDQHVIERNFNICFPNWLKPCYP